MPMTTPITIHMEIVVLTLGKQEFSKYQKYWVVIKIYLTKPLSSVTLAKGGSAHATSATPHFPSVVCRVLDKRFAQYQHYYSAGK
jgi:hypothetical protein